MVLLAQTVDGKTGMWRALPGGVLGLVNRSGDSLMIDGSLTPVVTFTIVSSAGAGGAGGGMGAAINDAGTIFATVSFGNGLHLARRFYP